MKSHPLAPAAVAGVVTFGTNQLAQVHGWYETLPFFDKWMHVAGGAFTLLVVAAYFRRASLGKLLAAVLLVGLLWEGYEYAVQSVLGAELIRLPDSLGDLVADVAGGAIAGSALFFVRGQKKLYNDSNERT